MSVYEVSFAVPGHTKAQIRRWLSSSARINGMPLLGLSIAGKMTVDQIRVNETLETVREQLIAPLHDRISRLESRVLALEPEVENEPEWAYDGRRRLRR